MVSHLCEIAAELERKSVQLKVLDHNLDTNDATGRLVFFMLGVIAQFETEIRAERQREGIAKAQERGVKFGATKKLTREQVAKLQTRRKEGALIRELIQEFGLSKTSVYRYLREKA